MRPLIISMYFQIARRKINRHKDIKRKGSNRYQQARVDLKAKASGTLKLTEDKLILQKSNELVARDMVPEQTHHIQAYQILSTFKVEISNNKMMHNLIISNQKTIRQQIRWAEWAKLAAKWWVRAVQSCIADLLESNRISQWTASKIKIVTNIHLKNPTLVHQMTRLKILAKINKKEKIDREINQIAQISVRNSYRTFSPRLASPQVCTHQSTTQQMKEWTTSSAAIANQIYRCQR